MILDISFWSKFVQEADLLADQNLCLQYSMVLADRFTSIEEFLSVDEKELIHLGITDATDRANLVKQARSIDENPSICSRPAIHRNYPDSWLVAHQSTPLNPKTFCNLSLGLFSRISFNDHPSSNDCVLSHHVDLLPTGSYDHLTRTPENQSKYIPSLSSCQKKTPLLSVYGMRTNKSLSDTISLQKKIPTGTDRLKRLTTTKSIFKRPTAIFRKQINNLKNKFLNSFSKMKISHETPILKTPRRSIKNRLNKPTIELVERGKLQMLSLNHELDGRFVNVENPILKCPTQPVLTVGPNRRFKIGAPTTFVTRAIANHSQYE